jgi:hypothetical protein
MRRERNDRLNVMHVLHNMPRLVGIVALVALVLSVASSADGGQVYKAVLSQPLKTRGGKTGDHVLLTTVLLKGPTDSPIGQLDASIAEVHPRAKGRDSVLKININRSLPGKSSQRMIEARVVAVIAQSMVKEWWGWPGAIADRYSHIPDDDRREPGEIKISEYERHTSPLDFQPDVPVLHTAVCLDRKNKGCTDLTDARGIYGFKGTTLLPIPTESVLSSKKNISFPAGTMLVLSIPKS